ncbi:MAG TPA: ATP-binding protein [Acidobacteriota bacterium]|jgi:serine/threonine-protein kinase RsbW
MSSRASLVEIRVESSLNSVELVQALTDNITKMMRFDEDSAHWIGMSVRESMINAIRHGNQYQEGKKVDVTFEIYVDRLVISIDDEGRGFDPESLPDPLAPENLLKPSGRGIFFVKSFMDQVNFLRSPAGGTRLRMMKRAPT